MLGAYTSSSSAIVAVTGGVSAPPPGVGGVASNPQAAAAAAVAALQRQQQSMQPQLAPAWGQPMQPQLPPPQPAVLEGKVYVGELSPDWTEQDLRNVFNPFGTVHHVGLPLVPGTAVCFHTITRNV